MTDQSTRELARLRSALGALQAINANMSVQSAISFLFLAQFEGHSLREYSEMLDVPQSTMSRHLLDLGPRLRDMSPGYGLIEQSIGVDDMRKRAYKLTAKGRALALTLIDLMEK